MHGTVAGAFTGLEAGRPVDHRRAELGYAGDPQVPLVAIVELQFQVPAGDLHEIHRAGVNVEAVGRRPRRGECRDRRQALLFQEVVDRRHVGSHTDVQIRHAESPQVLLNRRIGQQHAHRTLTRVGWHLDVFGREAGAHVRADSAAADHPAGHINIGDRATAVGHRHRAADRLGQRGQRVTQRSL